MQKASVKSVREIQDKKPIGTSIKMSYEVKSGDVIIMEAQRFVVMSSTGRLVENMVVIIGCPIVSYECQKIHSDVEFKFSPQTRISIAPVSKKRERTYWNNGRVIHRFS
jgi:hypothetical protein